MCASQWTGISNDFRPQAQILVEALSKQMEHDAQLWQDLLHVTRYGATLAYHTVFLPSVKYPLPQSFFTKTQLDKAQKTVMSTTIANCDYNRHAAYAILFLSTCYAGGGFVHWYTLEEEGQVINFMKDWRTGTMISQMLPIDLAWSQWQARISKPILVDADTRLQYLECRWLNSFRRFLQYIHATICATARALW
jgi:hypothetical protein